MTIEQTIDIPADYRLVMELPHTVPLGKAHVEVTIKQARRWSGVSKKNP
jgi:hypothetical protein